MKKFLSIFFINLILLMPVYSNTDKSSSDYLKNKKHFALMNPLAESIAQKAIKKSLKKKIGKGDYKVKFEIYTLSSLKKGIFKTLNIKGKNLIIEEIPIPLLVLKSATDYNWIDYQKDPVTIKSDIIFDYELDLNEDSINQALKNEKYLKNIDKINRKAYPLFEISNVKVKIKKNLAYIIMEYRLPLSNSDKKRVFIVSTDFKVSDGKIKAHNVAFNKSYGALSLDKVTNLINLIDPLTFTLAELNNKNCTGKIENVKIDDDIVKINGRIFIKGE